jgi:hypothetical protein
MAVLGSDSNKLAAAPATDASDLSTAAYDDGLDRRIGDQPS